MKFYTFILLWSTFNMGWTQSPFVTTWKTDNPGTSNNDQFTITIAPDFMYNYSVSWEEVENPANSGLIESITNDVTVTTGSPGIYRVEISGTFPGISTGRSGDEDKILTITQWGDIQWESPSFSNCSNLTITATDSPDLSQATSLRGMFQGCASLTDEDFSSWDVSSITNMNVIFNAARNFNGNVTTWDVSNVTNMSGMFIGTSFNQDIGSWDVGNVTNMESMFAGSVFNQDIGSWDVSNVTDMTQMFTGAKDFNQPIGGWDVSNVTLMSLMFEDAETFDQPIGSWNVGSVMDMSRMFQFAESFNQNLEDWNISSVSNLFDMFNFAFSFNQDLGAWDISSVTNMEGMLDVTALDVDNYNSTLSGWSTLDKNETIIPENITLGALNLVYSEPGELARNTLLNQPYNWTILGDSFSPEPLSTPQIPKHNIEIFPNPSVELLNIKMDSNEPLEAHLFNTRGQKISFNNGQGSLQINLIDFDDGIYILRVLSNDSSFSERIIKISNIR